MSNQAAYQKTHKSRPFTIEPAPMPSPKPHQIVIKTRAIGINPADAAVQNAGLVYAADAHPVILGLDIAGGVHAVGDAVTRFKAGDRVCAFPIDMGTFGEVESKLAHGAFQLYCVANEELTARVPENVEFSEAAVFPSCLSTAAWALFTKETMALDLPPVDGSAASNGKVVVIWGGSSVVGSCAIQMAHLAGYTVIATSSELNFEHCRSLGAEHVFDYKSSSVVDDIVAACKATGKECAGAFVAYYNDNSTISCSKIVSQLGGSKVVGTVVPPNHPVAEGVAEGVKITSSKFPVPDPGQGPQSRGRTDASLTFLPTSDWGPALGSTPEGIHLWQHWLTAALADGRLKLSPRPEVYGQGLEALQGAVDTMWDRVQMPFAGKTGETEKSISPRKLVVEIQ
ncbi:hypothetical protein MBLNU13_g05064t1 [Cladosporium sp. NU13]